MSEFTKGPWYQKEGYDMGIWNSDELVCNEVAANANLISAAPDMLEALEELIEAWNSSPEITHQIIKAMAVVAKAKGESK